MSALPAVADDPNPANDRNSNCLDSDELEFWERAFIAMAPSAIEQHGWKFGGARVASGEARMELCGAWADRAVIERRARAKSV